MHYAKAIYNRKAVGILNKRIPIIDDIKVYFLKELLACN